MALRSKSLDASALAARHAAAAQRRDAAIERAEADYAVTRQNVIDQGTQRVSQITVLQSELDRERQSLQAALASI